MSMSGSVGQSVGNKFGRQGQKKNPNPLLPLDTGYSSAMQGRVTIDPSIRAIQDRGLSRINDLYGETGRYGDELIGNSRSLRSRFEGNRSAYADSQLNPMRQQIASRRGEIQQNIGMRGISGSSFADQSINNFDTESNRELQDAGAKVEFEQLQALTGIDSQMAQQMFGKIAQQAQLNGESQEIAQQRLAQELAALGLGQQQINLMTSAFEATQKRRSQLQTDRTYQDSFTGSGSVGGSGSSIICTAMNEAYGFGDYRNKIWVKFGVSRMTNDHRLGYHFLFLPLVRYGFKSGDGFGKRIVRKTLEHIARHRTVDIRAVMHGYERDMVGMIYRVILEPTCRLFGFLIRKGIINKAKGT